MIAGVVCGRKFCPSCGWRHTVFFTVRKWMDEPYCTVPKQLASLCKTCNTIFARRRRGYQPRKLKMTRAEKIKRRSELESRPVARQKQAEYKRFFRHKVPEYNDDD